MTGTEATWYDVKRNMDRLPAFVDPEQTGLLRNSERGRLVRWLETRLKDRLVPYEMSLKASGCALPQCTTLINYSVTRTSGLGTSDLRRPAF